MQRALPYFEDFAVGAVMPTMRRTVAEADVEADYDACTQPVHLRHLEALASHRPAPLADPPPTLVLWGMADRAVPMEDHLELALQCQGARVPIVDAAHVPYFEQPDIVVRWIRHAAAMAWDGAA